MKTLEVMTNVEKAGVLFDLFPREIPEFLDAIHGMCQAVKEDEDGHKRAWNNGFLNWDLWFALLTEAERKIRRYKTKMAKNKRLFADQLFDGYVVMYTVHCLTSYAPTRQLANRKFTLAVDLLFNP
ncbi:hypothetical protein FMM05_20055 [Flavobacterium zepuense]|uniref:Uncharacterized protein n=1 Tax=Flavobacterium zepuense TaxID=2593302 RepID=A0A552UTK3_9FLAO|nr:hypothetical protein [Flavobacterium zepuense]TRW21553.1 hypothetical protein FMM05_20055 [Flavobacterium zepuense]